MKNLPALALLLSGLCVVALPVEAQEGQFRSGYVVCEAPGQLSFFMEPNVFDFVEREAPDSVRLYSDGHPDKKGKLMVDGRFRTVTKGRKALDRGWCQQSADVDAGIASVDTCDDWVPEIPNGGCRKVVLNDGAEWFTFGDAIRASDATDGPTVTVVTQNDRARLCPQPNCGTGEQLARILTGTTLSVIDSRSVKTGMQENRWYRVRYEGQEGWISEFDVKRRSP